MGGATEDDNGMTWFLEQANGGDIVVLRTSGSDGYNDYFYTDLGVNINSVETIVCTNNTSGSSSYIVQKINQAEGIWFAGGDQWTYVNYWRGTPVGDAINSAINDRKVVIGGTSAGMAIQGSHYFSAENGTVTSGTALVNPFDASVTVDSTRFIENNYMNNVVTDTHFDNPVRNGRLVVFLSRMLEDYGIQGKAIACDEYTAVCIDSAGIARVYGGFPTYDDNAYFVRVNCELPDVSPEECSPNTPLTWNLNAEALAVYRVKGNASGANYLDLNDWQSGNGGTWHRWYVDNGTFIESVGSVIDCESASLSEFILDIHIGPNPFMESIHVQSESIIESIEILNTLGEQVYFEQTSSKDASIELRGLASGLYMLRANSDKGTFEQQMVKR